VCPAPWAPVAPAWSAPVPSVTVLHFSASASRASGRPSSREVESHVRGAILAPSRGARESGGEEMALRSGKLFRGPSTEGPAAGVLSELTPAGAGLRLVSDAVGGTRLGAVFATTGNTSDAPGVTAFSTRVPESRGGATSSVPGTVDGCGGKASATLFGSRNPAGWCHGPGRR